jgi:pyruvate/2-oxoglutarate dehydrogenase complex dihydrolipoamide acyltransferase (E2) component
VNLFGQRKAPPPPELATMLARLDALERAFRSIQLEWEETFARVHKAMRRAVAAERNQDRRAAGAAPAAAEPPALPTRPVNLYGARGRIYVRELERIAAQRAGSASEDAPQSRLDRGASVVTPPAAHANGTAHAEEGE